MRTTAWEGNQIDERKTWAGAWAAQKISQPKYEQNSKLVEQSASLNDVGNSAAGTIEDSARLLPTTLTLQQHANARRTRQLALHMRPENTLGDPVLLLLSYAR